MPAPQAVRPNNQPRPSLQERSIMEFEERSSYHLYDQESLSSSNTSDIHKAIASGYLHKLARGSSVRKVWHKRYYVLYSDGLMYSYHNARSRTSHRTIPVGRLCLRMKFGKETVNGDCRSWPRSVPVEHRFSLINTDRSYHFYTESETDFSMWKQYLQSTLERLSSPSRALLDDEPTHNRNAQDLLQDEPRLGGSCKEAAVEAVTEDTLNNNSPYDTYTGAGIEHDSSSSSSEESIEYLHKTNSPLDMMLESTFGEITAFIV